MNDNTPNFLKPSSPSESSPQQSSEQVGQAQSTNTGESPSQPTPPQESQPNKTWATKFLIVIAVLLAVGASAFWYSNRLAWQNYEKVAEEAMKAQEEVSQQNKQRSKITTNDMSDWQTYRNEEFSIEFRYPPNIVLEENNMDEFCGKNFEPRGCLQVNIAWSNDNALLSYTYGPSYNLEGKKTEILVDGNYNLLNQGDGAYAVEIKKGEENILFLNEGNESDYELFLQILSTFKFIE